MLSSSLFPEPSTSYSPSSVWPDPGEVSGFKRFPTSDYQNIQPLFSKKRGLRNQVF